MTALAKAKAAQAMEVDKWGSITMGSLCMFRTGYEFTFRNHCYDFSPTYLLTKTMSRVVGNYELLKQYQTIALTLFLVCNVAY